MFKSLGYSGSGGLMVGIVVVFAVLPTMLLQWRGRTIRETRMANEQEKLAA
jgi:hypothetical protein